MDLHEVAEILAKTAPAGIRFRQATVVSVQADGTFTATIAGSTISVTAIKALAGVCPVPGHGVWLATDGADLFAFGTMGAIGPAFCSVVRSDAATIADTTDIQLSFEATATVIADTHGMFSTGTPNQLTCPVPGVYLLSANVCWNANAGGTRSAWITVAGTTVVRAAANAVAAGNHNHSFSAIVPVGLGGAIALFVRQSSGAGLALTMQTYAPQLTATWLRSHLA